MIRQLLIQLSGRKKKFILTGFILLIAFFVFVLSLNLIYESIVKSFSPRISVPLEYRIVVKFKWRMKEREQMSPTVLQQFKKSVEGLEGVEAASYTITDPVINYDETTEHRYNDHDFIVFCDEEYEKTFDLHLVQGHWFNKEEANQEPRPAVITARHAAKLGIDQLTKQSLYTYIERSGKDSIPYRVIGIVDNIEPMMGRGSIEKDVSPVFVPMTSSSFGAIENLFVIKTDRKVDQKALEKQVQTLLTKSGVDSYLLGYSIMPLKQTLKGQIIRHFSELKIVYGILLVLFSYILIALFGSFWRQTLKRTTEIGIRRALGHSRGKVVFYILAEPLLLLGIVMVPVTIIYLNLYKLIRMQAPLPVFLVCTGILLFIVLTASIIPAIRAGRIHPVEALSEE